MCENSRQIEDWSVFAGSSWVSIPRSDACALHMTGMRKVRTGWRQLYFASVLRVRPSREIPAKHSVLLDYHFWYTLSVPILYIPALSTNVEECFRKKNPSHKPWELEIIIPTILYIIACGFSSTPTSQFPCHWEVNSLNTYHTLQSVKWGFGVVRKHWKKSRMANATWCLLRDPES